MKILPVVTALLFVASVSIASAQGHGGGGHGGGGGHASGGGHSSGGGHGGGHGGSTGSHASAGTGSHGSGRSGSTSSSGASAHRGGQVSRKSDAAANESGVPTYSRPRNGRDPEGTAVPRGSVPTNVSPTTRLIVPAGVYYPPGFFGGYGYYGLGFSSLYSAYYDPWYGATYDSYGGSDALSSLDEGALRLKIKPRQAQVYVDGQYVGVVDDFDGIFQRLHLASGVHHVEVRADGYETLDVDVRIVADHKTTYEGELKRIQ
jgi:PEGA domain-containing protein